MTDILKKSEADEWSRERIDLLKRTICKDSTDEELELFIGVCKRTRLDPFARQIYCVPRYTSVKDSYGNWRKEKSMTIQVSIDGLRLIAERTGEYEGQTKPEWCNSTGEWIASWIHDYPPTAARIGIWRKGFREPLFRQARWKAFAQRKKDGTPTSMWGSMPEIMLLKCAESQALRAAFPQETSGLYTQEEMTQSEIQREESVKALPSHEPIANTTPYDPDNDFSQEWKGGVKPLESVVAKELEESVKPSTPLQEAEWDENGEVFEDVEQDSLIREISAKLLAIGSADDLRNWCHIFGTDYASVDDKLPIKKSWRSSINSCRKKYGLEATQIQEWLKSHVHEHE